LERRRREMGREGKEGIKKKIRKKGKRN